MRPTYENAKKCLLEGSDYELKMLGLAKALELVDAKDIRIWEKLGQSADPENLDSVREIFKRHGGMFRMTGYRVDLDTPRMKCFTAFMANQFRQRGESGLSSEFRALEHALCVATARTIVYGTKKLYECAGDHFHPLAYPTTLMHVKKHVEKHVAMDREAKIRKFIIATMRR